MALNPHIKVLERRDQRYTRGELGTIKKDLRPMVGPQRNSQKEMARN
jgi:hypothetical protein